MTSVFLHHHRLLYRINVHLEHVLEHGQRGKAKQSASVSKTINKTVSEIYSVLCELEIFLRGQCVNPERPVIIIHDDFKKANNYSDDVRRTYATLKDAVQIFDYITEPYSFYINTQVSACKSSGST